MKIAVFGATGGIGQHIVSHALAVRHQVTVIVRTPAKITARHPALTIVQGNVLTQEEHNLALVLAGHDAVLFALGVGSDRGPTTLYSQGARTVMQAMKATGVPRFMGVSASGFINHPSDGVLVKYAFKPLLQHMLKHPYDDLQRMEAEVQSSDLDWTLVRPARLTDGDHAGTYRMALGGLVVGGSAISRADVADFMVKNIVDPNVSRVAVGLAY
jgi:putative NADH-flavin reductase